MPWTKQPWLGVVGAALLFSTGGAAIKATTLSSLQVAGLRSGIAALALVALLKSARTGFGLRPALVGAAYAATLVLFVSANKLTTSAAAIFLQSTAPLYVLLLGPWLLRERIRGADLAVMTVVGCGLALLFAGPDAPARTAPDPVRGNLLALASGVTWALTIVGLRWVGSGERGTPMAAVVLGNGFACLACLPFALPIAGATATDWAALVYLGVFQIGAAYLLLTSAVPYVPALQASLLLLVEPALNPVWAWLVHGERPGAWTLVGGALVLAATAGAAATSQKAPAAE